MSIIGGILIFVAGVVSGGSLVAYNQYSIHSATSGLRKENERLRESAWTDKLESETSKAYAKGVKDGRKVPLSDVERFADTLNEGGYEFRMTRRGKHGKEQDPA